jgi:hypothetical protein
VVSSLSRVRSDPPALRLLLFAMAMAGAIGRTITRSPPPLSYGVDADSTRLERAHGLILWLTFSL